MSDLHFSTGSALEAKQIEAAALARLVQSMRAQLDHAQRDIEEMRKEAAKARGIAHALNSVAEALPLAFGTPGKEAASALLYTAYITPAAMVALLRRCTPV